MTSKKVKCDKINWSDSSETETEENTGNSNKISGRRCPYCLQLQKSALELAKHEKNCRVAANCKVKRVICKDGSKKFICQICCSTYKNLNLFQIHEKKHELPGGFFCKYCDFRCCHEATLEKHKTEEHKEFFCQLCKLTFETRELYFEHIKVQHDGRTSDYKVCEHCGRQFRYTEHLNYHKNTNCQTIFPVKCNECGKNFRSKGILKTHSLIHSGEKKFICSFCPMSFICKAQVVVHQRKHTGEKPFKCDICSKAFAHRESLVTHSTTHTGMKPYLCECCDARFSCVSSILAHRRTRPDTCGLPEYCTKLAKACPRATVPSKLSTEVRTVRPVTVIKTSDKEKLIEKRKSKVVKKSRTRRHKKEKVFVEEQEKSKNFNKNSDKFIVNSVECNNSKKINSVECYNFKNNGKKIELLGEHTEISNVARKKSKRNKKENIFVEQKDKSKNSIKKIDECIVNSVECNNSKKINSVECYNFKNNGKKIKRLGEHTEISNVARKKSKRNIKIINYSECDKEEIENKFEEVKIKNERIIENEENGIDNFTVTVNSQPEMENTDYKIKCEIESIKTEDCSNDFKRKIIKIGDESKKENFFKDENAKKRRNCSSSGASDLKCEISSNLLDNDNDSDSTSSDKFFNSLIFNDDMSDSEVEPIRIKNENSNKLPDTMNNTKPKTTEMEESQKEVKKNSRNKNADIFECIECIHKQQFRRKNSYEKHLRNSHNKTVSEIIEILSLKNHIPSDYSCKMCGKSFTYLKSLNQHMKLHGVDGKLIIKCRSCSKYFANKEELFKHSKENHKNQITCLICDKMYTDRSALQAHKRYAHMQREKSNVQSFICNKCGKILSSRSTLINHELSKCGTAHQYKCDECGKALSSPSTLKTHMMIHSGELPFLCPFCSKGFRTKAPMLIHQRMHTKEKPFQCTYCEKSFAYRENLFIHLSTHTGIKRYMCITCGDRFSCISGLKNHWRTHAETCGADPNRTTKASGEFLGYRKGQLENRKKTI